MAERGETVLVWDWTVRVFHWALVALVPALWWTAEQGAMDWHIRLGLVLTALVVFRLVWGVIGPATARFSGWRPLPGAIARHIGKLRRGRYAGRAGHGPLGALSVIAMLAVLGTQLVTGLFAVDVDGLNSGPLSRYVSFGTGRDMADLHEQSFDVLIVLIVLHILAVLAYRFVLGDRLIGPMLTGRRPRGQIGAGPAGDNRARPLAIAAATLIAAGALWLVLGV